MQYRHSYSDMVNRVELAVGRIMENTAENAEQRQLAIGEAVVDSLYGGSLDCWRRDTDPQGPFRQLGRHPKLPITSAELYRSVGVYEVMVRYDARNRWPGLSTSHFRCVIGIEPRLQMELLDTAAAKKWAVARMTREASRVRMTHREKRGRPATPKAVRVLRQLEELVQMVSDEGSHSRLIAECSPARLRELQETIGRLQEVCVQLRSAIDRMLPEAMDGVDRNSSMPSELDCRVLRDRPV